MVYGFYSLTKWWNMKNTLEDDARREIEQEREPIEPAAANLEDAEEPEDDGLKEHDTELSWEDEADDSDDTDDFGTYAEEDDEPAADLENDLL